MNADIVRALATLEIDPHNADALAMLTQLGGRPQPSEGASSATDGAMRRALAEARRTHLERGDFELVLKLYELEIGGERDTPRSADLYYEKAKLLSEELLRDEEAERAYRRVLDLRPEDSGAKEALEQLALVRDNWRKIVDKYVAEASASTDRQLSTSLYLSVAEHYARFQPGGDVEKYLRRSLDADPRNGRASMRLERLLRQEGRPGDLVALYEGRIESAATKEERLVALLALGELQLEAAAGEAAESFRKALAIDPSCPRAIAVLRDLYERPGSENWEALVRILEGAWRGRGRGEPDLVASLEIGRLWWHKLGNLEAAEEYWRRVRKLDAAQPEMLAFYRAYHQSDLSRLLPILTAAHRLEADSARRLELAVELADLAESTPGSTERAIDLWKGVLKQQPRHERAVAALRRLYQKTEKWNALLELLKELMEALPKEDVEGRVARLMDVVAIYRDRLGLDVMVISTYNQILQLAPTQRQALSALAEKYEALGRWNDLISVLGRIAETTTERADKARLLRRIAELWIDKFSNYNQALRPLEELYELTPDDAEVVARLRELYTRRRSFRALVELDRREVDRLASVAGEANVRERLQELARLAAERADDLPQAIAIWNRLLESDPEEPEALAALAGLYERERRWPALIEILRRQANPSRGSLEPEARLGLLERIGALFSERLDRPDKAIAAYEEIIRLAPGQPKAMRTLRELYAAAGRHSELEALHRDQGQLDELCDILITVAERTKGTDERLAIYRRVATIARDELHAPDRAAKAYERILALEPKDLEAARALVPIYRAGEKWARLLAIYEVLLAEEGGGETGAQRLELHREIVHICEEKLGSKTLAFSWAKKAYALAPEELALRQTLERLADEADAWQELFELYRTRVTAVPAEEVDQYRALAELARGRLNRPEEATRWYAEVLRLRPDDAEALERLEALYAKSGKKAELLEIYAKREAGASDPATRVELLRKMARIKEEDLRDLPGAIALHRQIAQHGEVAGAEAQSLRELERLHATGGDARGVATVLERRLALLPADDVDGRLELTQRLGELYELSLQDRERALTHYRAAFQLKPSGDHRATVTAFERWLSPENQKEERLLVARLLQPIYERRLAQGDPSVVDRLVAVLELIGEVESDPAVELTRWRRLMELSNRQGRDRPRAFDYGVRLFRREPRDLGNRRALAALAVDLDRLNDWAAELTEAERQAAAQGDRALAIELGWELGQLLEQQHRASDAEAAYRRLLSREPTHAQAETALVTLLQVHRRWPELRQLLVDKLREADDIDARRALLAQITDLDEGVLEDEEAVIRDFVEWLTLEPASTRAFRALDRIYTARQSWAALDELLERRIPHAPQVPEIGEQYAEALRLTSRRAELHVFRLDDPEGAVDLFEEVLRQAPAHEGARRNLEALMKREPLRQRIAARLEGFYRDDEAWSKLAQVLQVRREAAGGAEAVGLLAELAGLQEERIGARQLALATWREALRLEPRDSRAVDNIERLATLLRRDAELAAAWEEGFSAAAPDDLALRGEFLTRVARVYEERLRDLEKARATWRRLLELDPTNEPLVAPAVAALARLYEQARDWRALVEVLERQLGWATSTEERQALFARIGEIEEKRLGDRPAAIAVYRRALDEDPALLPALEALERLYQAAGQWTELIEILGRRLGMGGEARARRDFGWRIAQLHEQQLGDRPQAIVALRALLDEAPEDLPALEGLGRLFESEGRPDDLLEVLERRLALMDKRPAAVERVSLRLKIATLVGDMGRHEEAFDRYREVLELDRNDGRARAAIEAFLDDPELRLRAAEVLEPLYQGTPEIEKQIRISELWAEHAPDLHERLQRLRTIAGLRERGGDAEAAFEALARAARLAVAEPALTELLDLAERLAERVGADRLVALYCDLGPDILDPTLQERVYLSVAGRSYELGDRAVARDYFRRVLDASPGHPRALDALEAIYREGREWEALYEIYVRRIELAETAEERRGYRMKLAALCAPIDGTQSSPLDRPLEAMRAYEEILEASPGDKGAAAALEASYRAAHRYIELGELWQRRLSLGLDADQAAALRVRLGELYERELMDPERAVESYRAVLSSVPLHAGAIAALERYLGDPDQRVEAAQALELVYVARHDWTALVRVYELRLEAAADPGARLAIERRIAQIFEEQLEDLDGAFAWYARLFREDASDRTVRDQLARLAGVLHRWDRLADVYDSYLQDEGSGAAAATEVVRELAAIYHSRLNEVDQAKAAYERLLEVDRHDQEALEALEELLVRAARHQDLLHFYRAAAAQAADGEVQRTLLCKQARLEEGALGDPEAAIETWRAVLDRDGGDKEALEALDQLYLSGRRWPDLADLLLRKLDDVGHGSPEWVSLMLRLASVYEGELGNIGGAVDALEAVLEADPGEPDAVQLLERLVTHREYCYRIAQLLEPLYRERDAWQKLVVIYDAELEFIDSRARRVEILKEMAELYEQRGGDLKRAFGALARAWREEVAELDGEEARRREEALWQELLRLARRLEAWPRLVETLAAAVAESFDLELQATVYRRVAEIEERERGQLDAAVAAWRRVVQVREDDVFAYQALDRLLETQGRHGERVEVIERQLALADTGEEQKRLGHRLAEVHDGPLADPEAAITAWRAVLALDDRDESALAALERLYRARGADRELAEILAQKIDQAASVSAARGWRWERARLLEERLHDLPAAIEVFQAQLVATPGDEAALTELVRLNGREGLHADELAAIDRLAELALAANDAEKRAALGLQAARLLGGQLADPDTAIDRYREVLFAEAPESARAARQALEVLVRESATYEQAARVLEPYYEEQSDFGALIALSEVRLGAENDPIERRRLLSRIAELNEAGVGDLDAAFAAWARALAEEPADRTAQDELERLSAATNSAAELARVYEERLAGCFDPDAQATLALRLGGIYEERLGDLEHAITAYERALELPLADEARREALAALDHIFLGSRRFPALAKVLEAQAEATLVPAEQAEYWARLGALRVDELADAEGGISAYREALARAPEQPSARAGLERLLRARAHTAAALDLLEPLYESDGDWERVVRCEQLRLELAGDDDERRTRWERLAELSEKRLHDPGRAFGWIAQALGRFPGESQLAEELERLAHAVGDPQRAAEIIEAELLGASQGLTDETRVGLGLRAGRLWEELAEAKLAEGRYLKVLEIDGEQSEALTALERLYRATKAPAALAAILERRAQATYDLDDKKRRLGEAAQLYAGDLGDAAAALAAWRQVLAVDDSDATALAEASTLLERSEAWPELVELLLRRAALAPDGAAQRELRLRAATLLGGRVGDLARAADAYRGVLDEDPECEAALTELEAIERRRDDRLGLKEALVRQLRGGHGPRALPVYRKLVALAEEQGEVEDALGYLNEILEIDATDRQAQAKLMEILETSGRYHDLIDVLVGQADRHARAGESAAEVELLVRAAELWERKLAQPEASTEILERILAREPNHPRALLTLARIYLGEGRAEEARGILERALDHAAPEERADLHFQLANLVAASEGSEAAEPHWLRVLDSDSGHAGALDALEALARERGDWNRVAELLLLRLEVTSPAEKAARLLEIVEVYADKLGRPEAALPHLEPLCRATNAEPALIERLAELYFASGREDEALPLYRQLVVRLRGRRGRELARLHQRIGAIADRQGDLPLAAESYQAAMQLDPQHVPTMMALARLHMNGADWEKARRLFRAMLLQNLDASAGITKADIYLALGQIHEQLDETPKAIGMYERGLELDPGSSALKTAMVRVKAKR